MVEKEMHLIVGLKINFEDTTQSYEVICTSYPKAKMCTRFASLKNWVEKLKFLSQYFEMISRIFRRWRSQIWKKKKRKFGPLDSVKYLGLVFQVPPPSHAPTVHVNAIKRDWCVNDNARLHKTSATHFDFFRFVIFLKVRQKFIHFDLKLSPQKF